MQEIARHPRVGVVLIRGRNGAPLKKNVWSIVK